MSNFNKLSKPGLIPVKVENQGSLITTQVNKINFTGSGVTASVGEFNDVTILITGGGGSGVSSSYALTASYAETASYFSGSISNAISASYALSASYAFSASNAFSASFAETASSALNAQDVLIYVKNQSGYNIAKGMVVHITASGNSSDIPRVITASYENDNNSANTLGIANQAIANGSEGFVMTEGVLKGIDTNAYVSGQLIYLGASGSITGSAPRAPLHSVRLGQVVREQSNNGSVYVKIDNGYELGELHDVLDNTTSSSYGDLLVKSGSIWVTSKSLTGSYSITGSLTISGSSTFTNIGPAIFSGSLSVTNSITASIISATNNGNGTNFRVGDDVWIGDINVANTMQVMGQQNNDQGYIKFGNGASNPILGANNSSTLSLTGALTTTSTINNVTLDNNGWSSYGVIWTTDGAPPSVNNGVLEGYYKQIGKTVFVKVRLTFGTTTNAGTGTWYFSLPVNAASSYGIQFPCSILNDGAAWYQATVNGQYGGFTDKTAVIGQSAGGANSSQSITGVFPFTFGNLDSLQFNGSYEAL